MAFESEHRDAAIDDGENLPGGIDGAIGWLMSSVGSDVYVDDLVIGLPPMISSSSSVEFSSVQNG